MYQNCTYSDNTSRTLNIFPLSYIQPSPVQNMIKSHFSTQSKSLTFRNKKSPLLYLSGRILT